MSSLNVRWISSATRRARGNDFGIARSSLLNAARDLDTRVALYLITRAHIVVVAHANATFGSGSYFVDVVLETPQRFELTLENNDIVAEHADGIIPTNIA